jgi:replicative DNA helicase
VSAQPDVSLVDCIPPQNLEAEMALLGSAMMDRECYASAAEIVRSSDFYASLHETVWLAIAGLAETGKPVDKISLAEELRRRGMLEKVGGLAYLTRLLDSVPTPASTDYYARIVREKARCRGLIYAGTKITALGYNGEDDVDAAESEAEATMAAAVRGEIVREDPFESQTGIVAGALVDEYHAGKAPETGMNSPWPEVDDMTGTFQPREVIVWVAAPKVGKSGVVGTIGDFTAAVYPERGSVAQFANENGRRRSVQRHLAMRSGVSARRQRNHSFEPGDVQKLIAAQCAIASMPLFIFDHEYNSIAKMNRALRALRKQGPISTIILDHIGELEDVTSESGKSSKHERIERAGRALRKMAREFECPVHVVQHLNRNAGDGEPGAHSFKFIRDGGNIEGWADIVIFAHRDNPLGTQIERRMGVFVVALTRDGEGGRVAMDYQGHRNLWLQADQDTSVPWWFSGARNPGDDNLASPPFPISS